MKRERQLEVIADTDELAEYEGLEKRAGLGAR
jgi:hypothetical protein